MDDYSVGSVPQLTKAEELPIKKEGAPLTLDGLLAALSEKLSDMDIQGVLTLNLGNTEINKEVTDV